MAYRYRPFKDNHVEGMRQYRARGWSLRAIARVYGCDKDTVRETLDPELKARRNARRLARYHERRANQ